MSRAEGRPAQVVSGPSAADGHAARPTWIPEAVVGLLLGLGNFAAVTLMVAHLVSRFQHVHDDVGRNPDFLLPSDLAIPMAVWVWFLLLLDGLVLSLRRRTRPAGIGLVVAALVVAVPVVTWVVWTLATFATG